MATCFNQGYTDAKDGFEVNFFVKRGITDTLQKNAYLSGWYAYHSGVTDLNEVDIERADIWLNWD